MLKRNGEPIGYSVPGFSGKLTRSELDAYNEAFETIKTEFASLQHIRGLLDDLKKDPVFHTVPDSRDGEAVETQDEEIGHIQWVARSRLLKLDLCEVLLCDRWTNGQKEFGVIQRLPNGSSYARANGNAEVLLTGNDAVLLVQDYAANAQHTLKFMASNMVATAHKVVWERYANYNPSRVVQAISERCAQAAAHVRTEAQEYTLAPREANAKGIGV